MNYEKGQLPLEPAPQRLASLDVFRGLVMLLLVFFDGPNGGWGDPIVAQHPDVPWLHALINQFSHVEWEGLVLWDMIQPSFMFAVGSSLAFSYASRARRGDSFGQMLGHAVYRAIMLILLGVFLRSTHRDSTYWTFEDVVTQIGLGYVFLFLLWDRSWKVQLGAAAGILIGYWMLFAFWPAPGADYNYAAVEGQAYYDGFYAHWNKNSHPAHFADLWFLNLFPRESPFEFNGGGYDTLNFVPSLATMILGLMAGELLRGSDSPKRKLWLLLGGGAACLGLGLAAHFGGACPIVKKIWTPSFALVAGGISLATLGLLYAIVDIAGWRRWAFPAIVVGQNPVAAYVMIHLIAGWVLEAIHRHLGPQSWPMFGDSYRSLLEKLGPYQLLLENLLVGSCIWLICLWMYRRKIFIRL